MRIELRTALRSLLLGGLVVAAAAACVRRVPTADVPATPVNYYVRVESARSDRFFVSAVYDHIRQDSVDFRLPAWLPGGPGDLPMPRVESFLARGGHGAPIPAREVAAGHWRLYPGGEPYLTIGYEVVNPEPGGPLVFATHMDRHGGYALGGRLFGFIEGHAGRPVTVSFELPTRWRMTTTLGTGGAARRYEAPSFAALPGAVFVLGDRYREFKLFVSGRPHEVVVQGAPQTFEPDSLLTLVEEAIEHGTRFFGPPPYERYLFAIHFVEPGTPGIGATGQADGGVFYLPELDLRRVRPAGLGRLFLHQYFHAWYPGRFGPRALRQPDFRAPPPLDEVWLIEGAAEYYARLLPARYAGGAQGFYDAIGELLTWWSELEGGSRIDVATLERGGGDDSAARLIVGGALAAFVVDVAIRGDTRGVRGLDNLLYYLQQNGAGAGYDPAAVWREAAQTLGVPEAALSPMVEGANLSISAGLARAGLRVAQNPDRRRTLGARLHVSPTQAFVVHEVESGGTAASAGLVDGDLLTKINGTPIGPDETVATRYALTNYIREARTGAPITFEIVRDGATLEKRGVVRESRVSRVGLEEIPEPSATALIVRRSLFRPPSPSTGG